LYCLLGGWIFNPRRCRDTEDGPQTAIERIEDAQMAKYHAEAKAKVAEHYAESLKAMSGDNDKVENDKPEIESPIEGGVPMTEEEYNKMQEAEAEEWEHEALYEDNVDAQDVYDQQQEIQQQQEEQEELEDVTNEYMQEEEDRINQEQESQMDDEEEIDHPLVDELDPPQENPPAPPEQKPAQTPAETLPEQPQQQPQPQAIERPLGADQTPSRVLVKERPPERSPNPHADTSLNTESRPWVNPSEQMWPQ